MTILFVNRLTALDAALLHPERGLLGDSWLVDIELEGSLDHQGMVLDFGQVKRQVKRIIDQQFDHRLLLPLRYPGCRLEPEGDRCRVAFDLHSGGTIEHHSHLDALGLIDADAVDADSLARAITDSIGPQLPDNVQQVRIHLRPEQINGAWYQYSHGLKQHAGNCQRIAHGHRSRIHIYRDGKRDERLEREWADRWRDIYLATRADLQASSEQDGIRYCRFGYTAGQGHFELILPASRCYLIESDSTVENLARHIADTLGREHPGSRFRVQAFEGVDKGAIEES